MFYLLSQMLLKRQNFLVIGLILVTLICLVRLLQSVRFTLQWELPTPALLCMLCKMTPFFLVIHATRQALLRTVKALLISSLL